MSDHAGVKATQKIHNRQALVKSVSGKIETTLIEITAGFEKAICDTERGAIALAILKIDKIFGGQELCSCSFNFLKKGKMRETLSGFKNIKVQGSGFTRNKYIFAKRT